LVYDKTNRKTFDNVEGWISEVDKYANENTIKILLGNKSDLEEAVSHKEGEQKGENLGLIVLDTSAKSAENVETAFLTLAKEMIARKAASPESAKPPMLVQLP
jgi:Ras-related protein Rab-1A